MTAIMPGTRPDGRPVVLAGHPGAPGCLTVVECLDCAALIEVDAVERHLDWHAQRPVRRRRR